MRRAFYALPAAALLLLATAPVAAAQDEMTGRYTITVYGGQQLYDDASALQDGPFGMLEARYHVNEFLSVGGYLGASRPTTDETFFPLVRMEFNDTVFHFLVSQQVVNLDYGVNAGVRYPVGPVVLHGLAGIGRYVFRLDDQRIDRPARPGTIEDSFAGTEMVFGGGVQYALGSHGGITVELRDVVYSDYDRDQFSVSEPLLAAENVPHPRQDIPAKKDTIHNIRLQVGFSFTPGGER